MADISLLNCSKQESNHSHICPTCGQPIMGPAQLPPITRVSASLTCIAVIGILGAFLLLETEYSWELFQTETFRAIFGPDQRWKDSQQMMGKWFVPVHDLTLEFFPDGRLEYSEWSRLNKGKYKILKNHRIEINCKLSSMWSKEKLILRYYIVGDELWLKPVEGNEQVFGLKKRK